MHRSVDILLIHDIVFESSLASNLVTIGCSLFQTKTTALLLKPAIAPITNKTEYKAENVESNIF